MNSLLNGTRIALCALRVNKMRSALTMLGVIVGVAAVIAMVAVGAGASKRVQEQIESLGSNLLIVQPGSQNVGGVRNGWGNAVTLTRDDAEAIQRELSSTVLNAAPTVQSGAQIVYAGKNWNTRIDGVTPAYFSVRNFTFSAGTAFTEADDQLARKAAVIGRTVAEQLFGDADPIGQTIRLNNVPFVVFGTLNPKGQSPTGQDQDDTILIPLTTAKRKLVGRTWANAQSVRNIYVQARTAEVTPVVSTQIE